MNKAEEKFLKCIADNNRRLILWCLDSGEKCVSDIMELTNLEQTLVSFHLKALRGCGLVKRRRDGKKIVYRISRQDIMIILKSIREASSEIKELNLCDEC